MGSRLWRPAIAIEKRKVSSVDRPEKLMPTFFTQMLGALMTTSWFTLTAIVFCFLVPMQLLIWLAILLHQRKSSVRNTKIYSAEQRTWIAEMESFDRF
jgi:hypothetical protein